MPESPTTATFLNTDLEGLTRLRAQHRQALGTDLVRHDMPLQATSEEQAGTVFETFGTAALLRCLPRSLSFRRRPPARPPCL